MRTAAGRAGIRTDKRRGYRKDNPPGSCAGRVSAAPRGRDCRARTCPVELTPAPSSPDRYASVTRRTEPDRARGARARSPARRPRASATPRGGARASAGSILGRARQPLRRSEAAAGLVGGGARAPAALGGSRCAVPGRRCPCAPDGSGSRRWCVGPRCRRGSEAVGRRRCRTRCRCRTRARGAVPSGSRPEKLGRSATRRCWAPRRRPRSGRLGSGRCVREDGCSVRTRRGSR